MARRDDRWMPALLFAALMVSGAAAAGAQSRSINENEYYEGRDACVEAAFRDGYRVERVVEARPSGRNDLHVTLKVRRYGDRFRVLCVFDTRRRDTRIETADFDAHEPPNVGDRPRDALERRAQETCLGAARDRGLRVARVSEVKKWGHNNAAASLEVRSWRDRYTVICQYDDGRRRAWFEDEGDHADSDGMIERIRATCVRQAQRRGWEVAETGEVTLLSPASGYRMAMRVRYRDQRARALCRYRGGEVRFERA